MWPDNGGLTTSRGKTTEGKLSGDGGLLLTSLKVDSVSIGDMAKEDGGPMSTGLGLTLNGLTDDTMDVRKTNLIQSNKGQC